MTETDRQATGTRRPLRGIVLAGAAAAFAALSATGLALSARASQQVVAGSQPAADVVEAQPAALGWRTVAARHGGFDVDAPRWRPLGASVTVLRRADGLSRELFQFGRADDNRRYAMVAIDRGTIEAGGAGDDLTALAADLEIGARVRPAVQRLASKFGPLPAVDVTLDTAGGPKNCLGFALRAPEAGLRFAGLVCSGGSEIVNRAEAACFLDRIFAVGLREPAVAQIFVKAELRREPCTLPATVRVPGLERGGRPALRTSRL